MVRATRVGGVEDHFEEPRGSYLERPISVTAAENECKTSQYLSPASDILWDNNLIAGGVDRLRRLVDDLETTSKLYYHHQQQTSGSREQPSREDVRSVLRLRARAQRLSLALTNAHQDLFRADAEWALLSTFFDVSETCQLDATDQLPVTFLKVSAHSLSPKSIVTLHVLVHRLV